MHIVPNASSQYDAFGRVIDSPTKTLPVRRVACLDFFVLLALVFLATSAWADSVYDVNVWGTWNSKNSSCVSNCTETIGMSFLFVANPDPGVYGWIDLSSFKMGSSGFLGSFGLPNGATDAFGLLPVGHEADGLAFRNSLGDEIDLNHFGFLNNPPISLFVYDCLSDECRNGFPHSFTSAAYIEADYMKATVVSVSDGTSTWEALSITTLVCTLAMVVRARSPKILRG
jgi:hypothetical protein